MIMLFRCDDNYDKECKGEKTMPFYRAQYDTSTGQAPNTPREQVTIHVGFKSKNISTEFCFIYPLCVVSFYAVLKS